MASPDRHRSKIMFSLSSWFFILYGTELGSVTLKINNQQRESGLLCFFNVEYTQNTLGLRDSGRDSRDSDSGIVSESRPHITWESPNTWKHFGPELTQEQYSVFL